MDNELKNNSQEYDPDVIEIVENAREYVSPSDGAEKPLNKEEIKKAQKIMTDNEEIAAFNKEVLGELEPPLVVHKKSDESNDANAGVTEMSDTHADDSRPTLKRHRFKKERKKKYTGVKVFVLIVVIALAVLAGLYFTGNLPFGKTANTTQKTTQSQAEETTTSIVEKYKGTIVVKGMYIFVDGVEVDGVEGLEKAIKYVDKSTTAYTIIIEGKQSSDESLYYNNDILACLTENGFYGDDTKVEHKDSTGLVAAAETTTAATTAASTTTSAQAKTTSAAYAAAGESN